MAIPKVLDLNNVRYLLEAADRGSFSAAARILGVPPSLVSRKIARLEKELGARLFQRTTRSITLTDAGLAFLGHARTGMQSFSLGQDLLGDSQGVLAGRVRLSAPVGAASAIWATIAVFLRQHPDVTIEMEVADRYVDMVHERFDLAIRSGSESGTDKLIGRRLLNSPRCLFASPEYLKVHGIPRTVKALQDHTCVILGTRADRVTWHIHIGNRIQSVIVHGRVAVNEATIAAECAADGLGIAFLPLAVCVRFLESGRLKRILPRGGAGPVGLWIVFPNRHLPAVSRALVEFLMRELPASLTAGGTRGAHAQSP